MSLSIRTAEAATCCDAVVDAIDTGTTDAAGALIIYDGSEPDDVEVAIAGQTILAQLDMSNPAFTAATPTSGGTNSTATANAISDDTSADATGTAAFWRIENRDNVAVLQGTCGTSGQDINFNTLAIQSGATVQVTSLTITMPNGGT